MEIGSSAANAYLSTFSGVKANGQTNASAETQRAIGNGAVPTTVVRPVAETENLYQVNYQTPSNIAEQLASTGTINGANSGSVSASDQSVPEAGSILDIIV